MTIAVLKELREELLGMIDGYEESEGHDQRISRLVDLVEKASDELAEAYAALTTAATSRAVHLTTPGVWEQAYSGVIARAKTDHSKVVV